MTVLSPTATRHALLAALLSLTLALTLATGAVAAKDPVEGAWLPVNSTAIKALFYEPKSRTLIVRTSANAYVEYYGVPRALYRELVATRQKGGIYRSRIQQKFPSAQLTVTALRPPDTP